jgi:hypothetical protein
VIRRLAEFKDRRERREMGEEKKIIESEESPRRSRHS